MKLPPPIHRWSMSPKAAIRLQEKLADSVRVTRLRGVVRFVAGVDVAFSPDGAHCLAGVVIYDLSDRQVIEQQLSWRPARFPYVPGLLSFREAPAALAAIRKLRKEPDAFLFDAQGLAHPRRLGLASHAGLLIDRPSVGCAKSRLCGTHGGLGEQAGSSVALMDGDERIGTVLRTRTGVKPVYVSVGHRVTLGDAERIVRRCVTRFRLPEPARLAHQLVTRYRTQRLIKRT
jgi:deoxyribonuclease V